MITNQLKQKTHMHSTNQTDKPTETAHEKRKN